MEIKIVKHTPGPWKAGRTDESGLTPIHSNSQRDFAGVLYTNGLGTHLADAMLISAAPELLELLKRALEMLESNYPTFLADEIKAAIAKAEGVHHV